MPPSTSCVRVYTPSPLTPFPSDLLLEMALALRAHRAAAHDRHLDVLADSPLTDGPHFGDMKRNHALIRVRAGMTLDPREWLGRYWVGRSGLAPLASPQAKGGPIFVRRAHGAAGGPRVDVGPLLQKAVPDERPYLYDPLPSTCLHCSEPPLVNACAYVMLDAGVKPDAQLECFLLTERLPCASCVHVLKSFRQNFPGLRLHLLYFFDYESRVENRLETDMSDLADSIHLLEYIDGTDPGYKSEKVYGGNREPYGPSLNVWCAEALGPGEALVKPPANEVLPRGKGSPSVHFLSRISSRGRPRNDGVADG